MTRYLRFVVVALIVQTSPSILFALSAKGWVEEDCGGATFHIGKNDRASAGGELVFRLPTHGIPFGPTCRVGKVIRGWPRTASDVPLLVIAKRLLKRRSG